MSAKSTCQFMAQRFLISALLLLVSSSLVNAQVVLDSAGISDHYFAEIHSQVSSAYAPQAIDLGVSGDQFQEWDFSGIVVPESDTSRYHFYPADQLSPDQPELAHSDFYREINTSSGEGSEIRRVFIDVRESGVFNTGMEFKFETEELDSSFYSIPDSPQLVFPLPLTNGTQRAQTSKTALFTNSGMDSLLRTVSISADAYGEALFPDEQVRSVVRMTNAITEERISYNRDGSTDIETISIKEVMFLAKDGSSIQFTVDSLWTAGETDPRNIQVDFTGEVTLVSLESPYQLNGQPKTISLLGNYPNPFNPATTVEFILREASPVTLEIFTLHGQQVYRETGMLLPSGHHSIRVESRNWPSGIYWYRISSQLESATGKMTLIK